MGRKIIDISAGISPSTVVYPGDPETVIEAVSSIEGNGYAVSRVSFGTHTGTHVDAPAHILEGGPSVDRIPLESFMGKALVLDLSFVNRDISAEDMRLAFDGAAVSGANAVDVLLVRTCGPVRDHPDGGASSSQNCLLPSAGQWVMEQGFRIIGVDTLSVDASPSLENHRLFLENDVLIVENLDLSGADPGLYIFICLPLKLQGCEAAPARAILLDEGFFK